MRPGSATEIAELRLSFNKIGDRGACALADAWRAGGGRRLRECHLVSNAIGDEGACAIAAALHEMPALEALAFGSAMGGNFIGDSGARELAQALLQREGRRVALNLKLNRISEAMRAEIDAELLRSHGSRPSVGLLIDVS